jgi:hypothetical protein
MARLTAEIRRLKDGEEELLIVITWDGTRLEVPKGRDTSTFRWIARDGIYGRFNRRYTLDDGEAFVRELPWALHGSYLWASLREDCS